MNSINRWSKKNNFASEGEERAQEEKEISSNTNEKNYAVTRLINSKPRKEQIKAQNKNKSAEERRKKNKRSAKYQAQK